MTEITVQVADSYEFIESERSFSVKLSCGAEWEMYPTQWKFPAGSGKLVVSSDKTGSVSATFHVDDGSEVTSVLLLAAFCFVDGQIKISSEDGIDVGECVGCEVITSPMLSHGSRLVIECPDAIMMAKVQIVKGGQVTFDLEEERGKSFAGVSIIHGDDGVCSVFVDQHAENGLWIKDKRVKIGWFKTGHCYMIRLSIEHDDVRRYVSVGIMSSESVSFTMRNDGDAPKETFRYVTARDVNGSYIIDDLKSSKRS